MKSAIEQSVSAADKEYISNLLGREVYRDDMRWVRPPKNEWKICTCMPDVCVVSRHEVQEDSLSYYSECPTLESLTETEKSWEKVEVQTAEKVCLVREPAVVTEGRCCGA